ncbi:hypothetical protein DESA109040_07440 [Deinococcus saxicola]|uniref:thioredoxin family protein n=1 Tax=Deinococcus saxicola TaxID=249406 RepID=UPI0039F10580
MQDLIFRDTSDFDQALAGGMILVEFWSPDCGPCRIVGPALESLEAHYVEQVRFVRVNVDAHPDVALQQRVMGVPTVIIYEEGCPVDVLYSSYSPQVYRDRLDRVLQQSMT